MIISDLHTHSSFSTDSEAPQEEMLDRAISLGLKTYCFTDHYDYIWPEQYEDRFIFDVDKYFEKLTALKQAYKGKIEVLIGVEEGLRNEPGLPEHVKSFYDEMNSKYPFDFVIGSSHILRYYDPYYEDYWSGKPAPGKDLGAPDYAKNKERLSLEDGLREYFESILFNSKNYDNYDIYGHLDYIVRYAPGLSKEEKNYSPMDFKNIIDEILKGIIAKGKGIEINTSGIKYGLGYTHPKEWIVKRYHELGGEIITVGSDAHQKEHIAYGFDTAASVLENSGFKYYCIFRNRKPEFIKL